MIKFLLNYWQYVCRILTKNTILEFTDYTNLKCTNINKSERNSNTKLEENTNAASKHIFFLTDVHVIHFR